MKNPITHTSDRRDFIEDGSVLTAAALPSGIASVQAIDDQKIKVDLTEFQQVDDGIRQTFRLGIRILATCLFGLSLQVMAQEPDGTYNVKTIGTATGDGSTDDTVAIQNALNTAKGAGLDVYFPSGTYIISGNISIPDNTSILGDKSGLSLIKCVPATVAAPVAVMTLGKSSTDNDATTGNLMIEDMFFRNVRFFSRKKNISNQDIIKAGSGRGGEGQGAQSGKSRKDAYQSQYLRVGPGKSILA